MRCKSIVEPTSLQKGDEWLSPDGHSPPWRRVWNGTGWVEDLKAAGFPLTELSPENPDLSDVGTENEDDTEELDLDPDSLEEIEIEINDDQKPSLIEESTDEHRMQAEIPDRNGREQGAGGKPEPESKQRGKRGKVLKGGKGK